MTVLNLANAVRVGSATASKVYCGAVQVWSAVVAVAAPVLALISPTSDNTPDFTLTGDLAASDVIRFQYATNSSFTSATEITHTITAPEDAANSFSFSTGALADGAWWFRARIERGANVSGWSNTVSETISVVSASATTWNPSDKTAGLVLSNVNRTVTHPSGGNTVEGIRSVAAAVTNQKVYIEHIVTTITTNWFFGFQTSAGPLIAFVSTQTPSTGFLCSTSNGSFQCQDSPQDTGQLLGSGNAIVPGDRMCMAFNTATGKIWVRHNNGTWNPQDFPGDPVAGTGGATIPFVGPYYVWALLDANNGDVFTTAFASSDWLYAPPSGFTQVAA